MATDRSKTYLRGFGIPDARLDLDALQARGTGTTDSKYQEASPTAGTPEANQATHMHLEATGTPSQEGHILVTAHRAGNPGLERAGYYWSDQSAATPVDYGWDSFATVTGWETLSFTSATVTYTARPAVIRLQNGDLLAMAIQADTAGSEPLTPYYYTTATSTWAALSTLTLDDPAEQKGMGLLQTAAGRVLLFVQSSDNGQVDVYYSDDNGTSWAVLARRVLDSEPATADIREIAVAYSGGEVLLAVAWRDGSSNRTASVYGSQDGGHTFTQTLANWRTTATEDPESLVCVAATSGGFVIGYGDNDGTTTTHRTRRLASAMLDPSSMSTTSVGAGPTGGALASFAMWRGEDGLLYAVRFDGTNSQVGAMNRSDDDGVSWEAFGTASYYLGLDGSTTTNRFENWAAVDTGGRAALITRWTAATADEDARSVGVIWLGGYSTHTAPATDAPSTYRDTEQVILSERLSDNAGGGLYLPIEEPQNVGWTAAGAGTEDLVSPGVLQIDTTANQRYFYRTPGTSIDPQFGEFAVELDSGDGSVSSAQIVMQLQQGDSSASDYTVRIYLKHDEFRVVDVKGAVFISSAVSVDLTSFVHFRWAWDSGGPFKLWYSDDSSHGHNRVWTEVSISADPVDGGGASGVDRVLWGHISNITATSRWKMVGYCNWPGSWGPATTDFADSWSSPDDLHPRSFSEQPQLVHDGVFIAAKSGPAKIGDSWDTEQDADYSAKNLLWQVDPSPQRQWRHTTDENETLITFDLSGLTNGWLQSSTVFAALLNTNIRQGVLESYNGASWDTVMTLDARTGFDSLRFTRQGDVIAPDSGSAHKAERYINAGELVGGTVVFTGTSDYREILENTSGAWTDGTAAVPLIRMRNVDDTEGSTGACEFWAPSVVGIKHEVVNFGRYWRLRIPSQVTAQGDYRLGQLVIGRVHVFGQQYGRGFKFGVEPQVSVETLPDGSTRVRKAGKPVRFAEVGWTDAVDATQAQATDPVPDYVTGSAAGTPLASPSDALRSLAGQFIQQDGSVTPVMLFPIIKRGASAQIINDPNLFLWSRMESAVVRNNVLGDEGVDEVDRGDSIVFREIT